MVNFMLFAVLMMQVVTPGEMQCLGFIHESLLPMDVFVAGTEQEGMTALAYAGQMIQLNGPGLSKLKAGETYAVARADGRIREKMTQEEIGFYYKRLGTIRVEMVGPESAAAAVSTSCQPILKGDVILAAAGKPAIQFNGEISNRLTPFPKEGLTSSIIFGKDDAAYMAGGQFCFVGVGAKDGVKPGDRFTVFQPVPPFNPQDLAVKGMRQNMGYESAYPGKYPAALIDVLSDRKLPARAMGDIVIVDVFETTAAGKIINSFGDIHMGDLVIKR